MNSTERVLAALRLEQPDRVPVAEFIIDERVARAIIPDITDIQDFMDRMDYDAVCCKPVFRKTRENDDGTYTDEWGVTYKSGDSEVVSHPVSGPIRTIESAKAYRAPDPDASHRLGNLVDVVARYKGRRAILLHHRAAFMWSAYLMNMDNILAALIIEPALADFVMDMVLETNMQIVRNAIRAGVEVVVLADDYAYNSGPMMSPEIVSRHLIPRLARMVDMIHNEGALAIKHTDGNIYSILDMLISTGIDGINPLEPVAGMDLGTVKRLVGERICLVGNIDCGELLTNGTQADVEIAVAQSVKDAGSGGGFIVSSSNSIHSAVNPRNLVAMIEAVHRYG